MLRSDKDSKSDREWREENIVVPVAGTINFNNISHRSKINISLDQIEMNEGELDNAELDKMFKQIEDLINSESAMTPEQRENMKYIIEGLQAQIRRGKQNNKQLLRRFLRFLDDRVPEISRLVLDVLTRTS